MVQGESQTAQSIRVWPIFKSIDLRTEIRKPHEHNRTRTHGIAKIKEYPVRSYYPPRLPNLLGGQRPAHPTYRSTPPFFFKERSSAWWVCKCVRANSRRSSFRGSVWSSQHLFKQAPSLPSTRQSEGFFPDPVPFLSPPSLFFFFKGHQPRHTYRSTPSAKRRRSSELLLCTLPFHTLFFKVISLGTPTVQPLLLREEVISLLLCTLPFHTLFFGSSA
jgi:hypothetical protein